MQSFIYIYRFFFRNKYTFLLNFLGITVGLTATMIIIGIVYQEYNFDQLIPNSKNIYRLIHKTESGWDYSTAKPLAPALVSIIPEIEAACRFYPWYGYLSCNVDKKKFTEKNVLFTDSTFISMLKLPMLHGDIGSSRLSENSALLSKSGAFKYFGEENPIGKHLKIGKDRLFSIVGVYEDFATNSNFKGNIILDISIIHKLTQVYFPDDWNHNSEFSTFVEIHEDADMENLGSKIQDIHQQHATEKIGEFAFQSIYNIHTNKDIAWESVSQTNVNYLYLLMSVAAIIFFMSIANFNILYITTSLRRETGALVKISFGATRWNLFAEYLREILGVQFVALISSVILVLFYNEALTGSFHYLPKLIFANGHFVLFGFLTFCLVTGSMIPVFWLISKNRFRSISQKHSSSLQQARFTNYLVTTQLALCALLIASVLVIHKQSLFLSSYDVGYERDELITIPLNMHVGEGIYNEKLDVFCDEMKSYTGVQDITLGFSSPALVQTSKDEADWEGEPTSSKVRFCWNSVYYDYFETLRIEIVEGRSFNRDFSNDFDYDCSFANYILNQKAVDEMGIQNPIGKSFSQYGFKGQIVGVVEDFHFSSLHHEIYPMAFSMNPFYYNEIIIRINSSDKLVIDHIRKTWNKFLPDKALEINYVSNQLEFNYLAEQKLASLLSIITVIAVFIGIFGLITLTISSTQNRVKEIGIRKINGASTLQIIYMFNLDFIKWIVIGYFIIMPTAWFLMNKWLDNFAYRTNLGIVFFVLPGILLFILIITTVSLQSYKAATRNPVEVLRHD